MPREYKKNEFCEDVRCSMLNIESSMRPCSTDCPYSAYEFHDWAIKRKFKIVEDAE